MNREGYQTLREKFPGYYRRTGEELELIWDEGLIVLDSSVLLNLYSYSSNIREDLLGMLQKIKHRLWVPHQVVEEFHRRRLEVIAEQKAAYPGARTVLNAAQRSIFEAIKGIHEDSGIEIKDLLNGIKESFDGFVAKTERMEQESDIRSIRPTNLPDDDHIWKTVLNLLEGSTGVGLSQEYKKNVLDEEGPRRYEAKVPPGYEDSGKPGNRKFGDLILWLETIDKAKKAQKPVLLVTDDKKGDWYQRTGGKAFAPHPELVNEMHREAGVLFHALPSPEFLKQASKRFRREISQEAANEVDDELRPSDEGDDDRFEVEDRLEELIAEGHVWDAREAIRMTDARRIALEFDAHRVLREMEAARAIASGTDIVQEAARAVEAAKHAMRAADVVNQVREAEEAYKMYKQISRDYRL